MLPSSLLPKLKVPQPKWETDAHRVVAVQRRMQAVPMAFLQPVWFAQNPYILRALQPSEDRVSLKASLRTQSELEVVIGSLGRLVEWWDDCLPSLKQVVLSRNMLDGEIY